MLVHVTPPSSDRKAFRPKPYTRAPCDRARAPGSGGLDEIAVASDGVLMAESATGLHCSRSFDTNVRPERVRAYSAEPSSEYQTRSTGPVATEGRPNSMAEFPMCRQSSRVWPPRTCADTAAVHNSTSPAANRAVALGHMERVYCTLSIVRTGREISVFTLFSDQKASRRPSCYAI